MVSVELTVHFCYYLAYGIIVYFILYYRVQIVHRLLQFIHQFFRALLLDLDLESWHWSCVLAQLLSQTYTKTLGYQRP